MQYDENFYADLQIEEEAYQKALDEEGEKANNNYQQAILDREEREIERAEEHYAPAEGF